MAGYLKYSITSTSPTPQSNFEGQIEVQGISQRIAIVALNCLVNIIALAVNMSVFINIVKANLQTGLKIFLANMTLVDLFTSVVLQPIFSATLILQIIGQQNLIIELTNAILWYFIFPISLMAFTAVSIERCMLIYQPLRSDSIISAKLAVGISIFSWILSTALRVGTFYSRNPAIVETALNGSMLLIVLGLLIIHLRIFLTARRVRNRVNHAIPGQPVDRRVAEIKLAAITTGMFVTILISYPPYVITRLIIQTTEDIELDQTIEQWLILFITISAVLKQFLLGILNRDVRSQIIRQWRIFRRKKLIKQEFLHQSTSKQFKVGIFTIT